MDQPVIWKLQNCIIYRKCDRQYKVTKPTYYAILGLFLQPNLEISPTRGLKSLFSLMTGFSTPIFYLKLLMVRSQPAIQQEVSTGDLYMCKS